MPAFSKAVWYEGDQRRYGTVLSSWISEETLYYPRKNAYFYMVMKKKPKKDWYTFPIEKILFSDDDITLVENYEFPSTDANSDSDNECRSSHSSAEIQNATSKDVNNDSDEVQKNEKECDGEDEDSDVGDCNSVANNCDSEKDSGAIHLGKATPTSKKSFLNRRKSTTSGTQGSNNIGAGSVKKSNISKRSSPRKNASSKSTPLLNRKRINKADISSLTVSRPKLSKKMKKQAPFSITDETENNDIDLELSGIQNSSPSSSGIFSATTSPESSTKSTDKVLGKVLFMLSEQRVMLKDIFRKLDSSSFASAEENKDMGPDFEKIDTLEEFDGLEELLAQTEEQSKLKAWLSRCGGDNREELVRRMFKKLMSDSLLSEFNMDGRGDKRGIGKTKTYQVIEDVAAKMYGDTKKVKSAAANYIKAAPHRAGGKKKD